MLVLPYRQPLHWAKIATTLDCLSKGRFILGVGVGWMKEEFDALQAPFRDRGRISNEQLEILEKLLHTDHVSFAGDFYHFDDIAFYPKSHRKGGLPIWVGGEGRRAQQRAASYGNAWFPYFVRITPDELARRFANVRRMAEKAGRSPDDVLLNCCLPIEVTEEPIPQEPDRLAGTTDQLADALNGFQEIGLDHLALQFMVPHWPERLEQMQRFAEEVLSKIAEG